MTRCPYCDNHPADRDRVAELERELHNTNAMLKMGQDALAMVLRNERKRITEAVEAVWKDDDDSEELEVLRRIINPEDTDGQ